MICCSRFGLRRFWVPRGRRWAISRFLWFQQGPTVGDFKIPLLSAGASSGRFQESSGFSRGQQGTISRFLCFTSGQQGAMSRFLCFQPGPTVGDFKISPLSAEASSGRFQDSSGSAGASNGRFQNSSGFSRGQQWAISRFLCFAVGDFKIPLISAGASRG